jgi:hypothetical protein
MKPTENTKKQEVTKIDILDQVIDAVERFDSARLSTSPDTEKLHKQAVNAIVKANNQYGDGFVSISKCRNLQQAAHVRKKEEATFRKNKYVQTHRQE